VRLVVCDDHRLLLEALSLALGESGQEVLAMAVNTTDAVAAVREHQPDAVLLDLNFPDGTDLGSISDLRPACPTAKIVILSASADHSVVAEAIAQGAHGFIGKDRPVADIVGALEQARRGQTAVDPVLLQQALRPRPAVDDPLWVLKFLTDREWEVMRCIMDGQSTDEMAESLGVRRSTARTHVQNLLAKLGVHSRLQVAALMTAHGTPEMWPPRMR